MAQLRKTEEERAIDSAVSTGAYPTLETLGYIGSDARRALHVNEKERVAEGRNRPFASRASASMSKDEVSLLLRRKAQHSILYAIAAIPFALMAVVAFYDLVLELTTGQMITIIADTVVTLDPPFFMIVIVLGAFFAILLVRLALSTFLNTTWQRDRGGSPSVS